MTGWQFAATEGSQKLTSAALGAYYHKLIEDYPIDSIEDPFAEVRGLQPFTLHISLLLLACQQDKLGSCAVSGLALRLSVTWVMVFVCLGRLGGVEHLLAPSHGPCADCGRRSHCHVREACAAGHRLQGRKLRATQGNPLYSSKEEGLLILICVD